MKVLQIAPYFTPYVGGQERYIHNLSKHLVKLGDEVDIVTSNYPISSEFEKVDGFSVHRYPCIARPMRNPIVPSLFDISEEIDDYDVIHTHNEHAFPAYVASRLAAKHDIPLVLTCHGQLTFGNSVLDFVEKTYMQMIARGIFDRADAICVNSPMDRDHISRFVSNDASSIWQVSNAVDPDQLSRLRRGEPGDEIQRFSEMASFKVLFVGSFIKRKGVETLVRAIKHLSTVHPEENVSLLMVGDGVEKPHIQKLIAKYGLQDKVHIIGLVNDVELAHLYASADALALPSLSEVCPTVVLEAMYFGLPVIATDIPGIRDHFKDTAWLIPPGDDEKLANAIYGLVKNPDHSEWMRKIGRDFVLRSYTWDKIARDYQLIYRQVSSMSKSVKRWMATENEERMLDKEDWEALPD